MLFFQVPPSLALVQGLDIGANGHNSAVAVDAEGTNAQYVLSGRVVNGSPEFAWVQVRLSPSSIRAGTSIPLRTAWVRPDGMAARVLSDHAVKLGRIRGWLLLENARDAFFPYHVGLIRAGVTGLSPSFHSAGVVTQGEEYDVVIHADGPVPASVPRRYVYVFVVTQTGESQLVFPDPQLGGAGGENYLPAASGGAVPRQINLGTRIRISPPYGTDTYIMLATDEPLVNPGVLQFSGVSTTLRGASSPLVRLIANAGRPTRGVERVSVPTDWSIDRASFMSQARPAAGAPPAKWGQ